MDRAELRRLAEAAIEKQDNIIGPYNDETAVAWGKALQAYTKAANPAAIIKLLDEIAAANARIAELEKQQFAGQTWVTFDEHMKALRKIRQMEDDIAKIDDFEMVVVMNQKLSKNADSLSKALNDAIATAKHHEQRADQAEAQAAAMRVCGNCRHYSQCYTVDCCVKNCGHGEDETRRDNTCPDWEMV